MRPRWSDEDALAEHDPWFGITDPIPEKERVGAAVDGARRRGGACAVRERTGRERRHRGRARRGDSRAAARRAAEQPLLAVHHRRVAPTRARRERSRCFTPTAILTDPKAAPLRAAAYRRYREYFHFINELQALHGDRRYPPVRRQRLRRRPRRRSTSCRRRSSTTRWWSTAASATTALASSLAASSPTGEWDVRPHRERLVHVDDCDACSAWAALLAYDDPASAPVVKSVTSAEAAAAEAIAAIRTASADTKYFWSAGVRRVRRPEDGLIAERTAVPTSWDEVILQGPHIGICTPFAKQPRPSDAHQQDYESWDSKTLPESVIPRTNWQRLASRGRSSRRRFRAGTGSCSTERYRMIVRRQVPSNTARSVFAALLPPRPTAVSVCYLGALQRRRSTVAFCGLLGGLACRISSSRATGIGRPPRQRDRALPCRSHRDDPSCSTPWYIGRCG